MQIKFLDNVFFFFWQMGAEQMTMKEAMKKMKEQTAQMALKAQQDAEAAAAEREAAESELGLTRQALEAEQNKVKSVEVLYRMLLIYPCVHTLRILRVADEATNSTAHSTQPPSPGPAQPSPAQPSPAQQVCVHAEPAASHAAEHSHASRQCVCVCMHNHLSHDSCLCAEPGAICGKKIRKKIKVYALQP